MTVTGGWAPLPPCARSEVFNADGSWAAEVEYLFNPWSKAIIMRMYKYIYIYVYTHQLVKKDSKTEK